MFAIDIQRKIDMTAESDGDWRGEHTDTATLVLPHETKLKAAVDLLHVISESARVGHDPMVRSWGNENATLIYVRLRMFDNFTESGTVISRLSPEGTGDW